MAGAAAARRRRHLLPRGSKRTVSAIGHGGRKPVPVVGEAGLHSDQTTQTVRQKGGQSCERSMAAKEEFCRPAPSLSPTTERPLSTVGERVQAGSEPEKD